MGTLFDTIFGGWFDLVRKALVEHENALCSADARRTRHSGEARGPHVPVCSRRRGVKERTLTRRDFLKVAGAGAAGATMLGAAGCGSLASSVTQVPDEYLPSGGSRMNVILVIIDSLRRDHLGVYGNDW